MCLIFKGKETKCSLTTNDDKVNRVIYVKPSLNVSTAKDYHCDMSHDHGIAILGAIMWRVGQS